jgi:hypothetical protein
LPGHRNVPDKAVRQPLMMGTRSGRRVGAPYLKTCRLQRQEKSSIGGSSSCWIVGSTSDRAQVISTSVPIAMLIRLARWRHEITNTKFCCHGSTRPAGTATWRPGATNTGHKSCGRRAAERLTPRADRPAGDGAKRGVTIGPRGSSQPRAPGTDGRAVLSLCRRPAASDPHGAVATATATSIERRRWASAITMSRNNCRFLRMKHEMNTARFASVALRNPHIAAPSRASSGPALLVAAIDVPTSQSRYRRACHWRTPGRPLRAH